MDAPYWIFTIWALLIASPILVQAQINTQDPNESGSDWGESSSFIGHKAKIIIIVLSVIAGVVVIFSVASSILYVIAKRRQWAVRETIRRSARRMADAIKSPLTPRFPRSVGESSKGKKPSYTRRESRRERQNRSSRGMIRIAEEGSSPPYILKDDDGVSALADSQASREGSERYVKTTKSIWRHSHSESNGNNANTNNKTNAEPYFFDFGPKPRDSGEKKLHKLKQKRPDFDLERGIELGATDHMKVTVSLSTTRDSDKSAVESAAKKNWGSLFAFGGR